MEPLTAVEDRRAMGVQVELSGRTEYMAAMPV